MCMHKLCSSGKILKKLNNSLRFRAMYDKNLRAIFSEKVPVYFLSKMIRSMHFLNIILLRGEL